jgi:hypothetical protein
MAAAGYYKRWYHLQDSQVYVHGKKKLNVSHTIFSRVADIPADWYHLQDSQVYVHGKKRKEKKINVSHTIFSRVADIPGYSLSSQHMLRR